MTDMLPSFIQRLAVSGAATRLAAALTDGTVQVWELQTGEQLAQFESVFSFGGHRLSLDPIGSLCVAAGWQRGARGGVACYEARSGAVVWHRPELEQTHRLRFSRNGDTIWCVTASGPTKILDARTGEILETRLELKDLFESSSSTALLLEERKRDYILRNCDGGSCHVSRLTFAILDAAFSPDSLCISESRGLVRCVGISSGAEGWRYDPGNGRHVLRLWYQEADRKFYGVRWEYEQGTPRGLVSFDSESGECKDISELTSWEEEVCLQLNCLATSHGELLSLTDGKVLNRLAFPQRGYLDE